MLFSLSAATVPLALLASIHFSAASFWPVILIGTVAFFLLGPYSYLGGAFALDLGGSQASAASSRMIDGVGYLDGILAGDSVALSVFIGWRGVFLALTVVTALSAIAAAYLCLHQRLMQRNERIGDDRH